MLFQSSNSDTIFCNPCPRWNGQTGTSFLYTSTGLVLGHMVAPFAARKLSPLSARSFSEYRPDWRIGSYSLLRSNAPPRRRTSKEKYLPNNWNQRNEHGIREGWRVRCYEWAQTNVWTREHYFLPSFRKYHGKQKKAQHTVLQNSFVICPSKSFFFRPLTL